MTDRYLPNGKIFNTQTPITMLRNNCVPVAIKEITAISDDKIINTLIDFGWIPNYGSNQIQYLKALSKLGVNYKKLYTVKRICETYSSGTYLVRVNGHAFVIRNGITVDHNVKTNGLKRKVLNLFMIENPRSVTYSSRVIFHTYPLNAFPKSEENLKLYYQAYVLAKDYYDNHMKYIEKEHLPKEFIDKLFNKCFMKGFIRYDELS